MQSSCAAMSESLDEAKANHANTLQQQQQASDISLQQMLQSAAQQQHHWAESEAELAAELSSTKQLYEQALAELRLQHDQKVQELRSELMQIQQAHETQQSALTQQHENELAELQFKAEQAAHDSAQTVSVLRSEHEAHHQQLQQEHATALEDLQLQLRDELQTRHEAQTQVHVLVNLLQCITTRLRHHCNSKTSKPAHAYSECSSLNRAILQARELTLTC